jgi:membrane protein implicated in regulation of membrane protease activity
MDDRIYSLGLFIHVVAVTGLFFGIGLELLHVTSLRRAQTVGQVQQLHIMDAILERLMPAATVLIIASGLFMLIKGWSWSAHWAEVAFVSVVLAAGLGSGVLGRKSKAIDVAAHNEPPGPISASLRAQIMDPVLYTATWVLAGLGIGILYLMTNKPETVESIAAMVLAVIVAVAGARLTDRRATVVTGVTEREITATRR